MAYKMTPGGSGRSPNPLPSSISRAPTPSPAPSGSALKRSNARETSVVDVSLLHVGMWALSPDITGAPYLGNRGSMGDRTQMPNPLVNGYATKDDRWIYFVCLQPDRFWDEFCTLLGRPDLIDNPATTT